MPGAWPPRRSETLENPGYEIFILALSVLSLVNLFLLLPSRRCRRAAPNVFDHRRDPHARLPVDFTYRLLSADTKRGYFIRDRGWLDLVGSLPLLRVFRSSACCASVVSCGRTASDARALAAPRAGAERALRRHVPRHPRARGVVDPDAAARGAVARREHHDRRRRALVGHRHRDDRRLRRPVPGHDRRTVHRRARADPRRRAVRHLHGLPRELVPRRSRSRRTPSVEPGSPRAIVEDVRRELEEQEEPKRGPARALEELEAAL